MRVLHFTERFSPTSETFIYEYIKELEGQGVDNHIATLRRTNERERPFPKVSKVKWPSRWDPRRLWRFGHHLTEGDNVRASKTLSAWPRVRQQLEEISRRVEPDVIHAHFGPAGVLAVPVAQASEIPIAITLYGHDVSRLARNPFWRKRYPYAFKKASKLFGISSHICSRIEDLGGASEKIQCWHLGVDLSKFDYTPADTTFGGTTVKCLHVGRLVEKKSPIDLVNAFSYARESTKDVDLHLTVAGDGPLRRDLEREVERIGVEDRVEILGSVSHTRVRSLMREANIYTQHCRTASDGDQEGQGVSFVEASASGLPIVATRHNGLPDVILDGVTGHLVEEGKTQAMGQKIASLAVDPDRWIEMGRAGREHIEKNFDLQSQVRKIKKMLSHLAQ